MATWVDYNNDGQMDLFIATGEGRDYWDLWFKNITLPNSFKMFKNMGNTNNWLNIRLVGTKSNREGIGAKIMLKTKEGVQYHEVNHGSNGFTQDVLPTHFGLGKVQTIDYIKVKWPSGTEQTILEPTVKKTLTIIES